MKKTLFILSLIFTPAIASAAPQCNAGSVGMTQCMSGRECECKFFRKSEMAGTPDRFSWDCSLLRPNCGATTDQNVTIQTPYNGPSSVGLSTSTSSTNVTQNPITTNTQVQSPDITQQQQSPTTTSTQTQTQSGTQNNNQNSTQNH